MSARIQHDMPVTAYRLVYEIDNLGYVSCVECAKGREYSTVEIIETTEERLLKSLLSHATMYDTTPKCERCYRDLWSERQASEARATVEYPVCKIF